MNRKKTTSDKNSISREKSRQRATAVERSTGRIKTSIPHIRIQSVKRTTIRQSSSSILSSIVPRNLSSHNSNNEEPTAIYSSINKETSCISMRTNTVADSASITVANAGSNTTTAKLRRPLASRSTQNYIIIWLDAGIDENDDDDCHHILSKLQRVVNEIHTFTDIEECIEFVKQVVNEKIFLITSNNAGKNIIPVIHDLPQMSVCYIFCTNESRSEIWTKEWAKIMGVCTEIEHICNALKRTSIQLDYCLFPTTLLSTSDHASNRDLDELDPSFMYTTVLKEIILEIKFDETAIKDFADYYSEQFAENHTELNNISKFKSDYHAHTPIWWYTSDSFLYSFLNRALRIMHIDVIIRMGFFLRDLHHQIKQLHLEQFSELQQSGSLIVYRGQGLLAVDFNQIIQTKGGLISFNNFLSTSRDSDISLMFAQSVVDYSDMFGILFVISIDLSISTVPFASVKNESHFKSEDEVLFSMNSIFRIQDIRSMGNNKRLFQVNLQLTDAIDKELSAFTERMRVETEESSGWHRLGRLLLKLNNFEKAQQIYEVLLKQAAEECEKAPLYNQIGLIKDGLGDYKNAIIYYQRTVDYLLRILSPSDPVLATVYNNIGAAYECMGEYPEALSLHGKALDIRQKALPSDHPDLAESYNNIGAVYYQVKEYTKAILYYKKALAIFLKTLPAHHPSLATAYNNIGGVYDNMGDHTKARSFYQDALKIDEKSLHSNHPDLAVSYNNLGLVCDNLGEFTEALSYHERALEIYKRTLPSDHPDIASSYNNIGSLYDRMNDHSKAISYNQHAVDVAERTLPTNHPHLQQLKRNLETVRKRH